MVHKYESNIQQHKNLHHDLSSLHFSTFYYYYYFYYVNLNSLFNFCKIQVYSTLYLIMKFLGYAIYLMADSNDFLTKFFLKNLISCVIFL